MADDASTPERPSWDALLVVCKACQKRSSGPDDLKSKTVLREAREALKSVRPRPRVVLSTCLGLCPKAAIAVAFVGREGAPRITAVKSEKQVGKRVALLIA